MSGRRRPARSAGRGRGVCEASLEPPQRGLRARARSLLVLAEPQADGDGLARLVVEGQQGVHEEEQRIRQLEIVPRAQHVCVELLGQLVAEVAHGATREWNRRRGGRRPREQASDRVQRGSLLGAAPGHQPGMDRPPAVQLEPTAAYAQDQVGIHARKGETPQLPHAKRAVQEPGVAPGAQALVGVEHVLRIDLAQHMDGASGGFEHVGVSGGAGKLPQE